MQRTIWALVAALLFAVIAGAQSSEIAHAKAPETEKASPQDPGKSKKDSSKRSQKPVVVTATRSAQDPFELPYSTSALDQGDVRTRQQTRSFPEAFRETAGVSVQKTAHGQGSPKIRGMTGFHTLLLVDGIRMNDSTWRSGNVEYWNQLDPYAFDRIELVRGPGSVLWGSDAVSGLGHGFSKGRESFEKGFHSDSYVLGRYSNAENSWIGHVENEGNVDDFGWHLGTSYKDYGDLSGGRQVGVMDDTGYKAYDGDGKLSWRIDETQRLSFGFQVNYLEDVPRTHSTTKNPTWRGLTAGSDLKREHTHRRQLYYLKYELEANSFFDHFEGSLSWKNRIEREDRVRSSGRNRLSELNVNTLGLTAQFQKDIGPGALTYGFDWYHDFIDSSYSEYNADGSLRSTRNRGVVAGDADYDLAGLFAQYEVEAANDLTLLIGGRWTYAAMDARDVDVPGDGLTFDNIKDDWNQLTGNLRAIYRAREDVRIFGGISQGFRAPNLSDSTRFDSARTGEVETPSSGLKPEEFYNFELGSRYDDGNYSIAGTAYYTIVQDRISRFRTGTTIDGEAEVQKANIGDGWYAGFELEGSATLASFGEATWLQDWALFGYVDYVDAKVDRLNNAGDMVHERPKAMPPASGMLGLRWTSPVHHTGFEAYTRMAYHVKSSRYTEEDRSNTSRIPPDGLPGYATVNLRGWLEVSRDVTASIALENIGDIDYRIMDSGLNEPGANMIFTVQARF